MQMKDRTGERFGQIVVMGYEHKVISTGQQLVKVIVWKCQCDCGRMMEVRSSRLTERGVKRCKECEAESKRAVEEERERAREEAEIDREESSPYILDYKRYRAMFSLKQRERYEELMEGRTGERMEREAVDVVMREPEPWICCERCMRGEERPAEETENVEEED